MQSGRLRRLDDRFDELLERRLGLGPGPSLGQHVVMAFVVSSIISLVVLIAMVLSDRADHSSMLIGPIVGTTLGTALGRAWLDHRKRQRS